jgi:surfeit locus 1 family protein
MNYTFHFRPVLAVFTVAALAVLISLGNWQMKRLAWKLDLIEKVETRTNAAPLPMVDALTRAGEGQDMEYMPVSVRGVFQHEREVHVFGADEGTPGWFILTPLATEDGRIIYVNRGFVPQAAKEATVRADGQVEGVVEVTGLYRAPETRTGFAKMLQPVDSPDKNEWYTKDPALFEAAQPLDALPVIVDSFGEEAPSGLPKGGMTRLDFNNRHLSYALTWYGLALTLVGVFVVFSLRRREP